MYKMIAVDLDDTLLDDTNQVSTQNREAIERVLALGIKVSIITTTTGCFVKIKQNKQMSI